MKTVFGLLRRVWKADAFSPAAFVARAVIVAVLFCISELAGLREYTTFLSGTSAKDISAKPLKHVGPRPGGDDLLNFLFFDKRTAWHGLLLPCEASAI